MTTAGILESITDRARFELLATSVLRKADPKYTGIIHTGVNAQGETVVAHVDGLHVVPHSDPPHYVFVQHTTTDRKGLRGKWLSSQAADMTKATAEAEAVRRKHLIAEFTVVLTTNQRVDEKLAADVYERAKTAKVAVDIWEQSRFADFLDTTADGHWLRSLYLGIKAERLSAELLRQFGQRSLKSYQEEMPLPGQGPLVRRAVVNDILGNAHPGGPGTCLLLGRSGYGKSVAAMQALEEWLSAGRLGLWLPARFLREAVCLESALDAWLRSMHPSLEPDAGRLATGLAYQAGRLLICLDDINRTPEADRLLRLVVNHAAPPSGGPHPADSLYLVVPVWPEQLSSLTPKFVDKSGVAMANVGDLLPNECSEIIRAKVPRLSPAQAHEYAIRLNHDPFLVGIFTLMTDEQMDNARLAVVADDAVGQFLDAQFGQVCSDRRIDLLPSELLDVLSQVARKMVLQRNLRPLWSDLEGWFGDRSKVLRGLRSLVAQGHVCRLDVEKRLSLRHDRLQRHFLVRAMVDLLRLPTLPEDIVTDPYYSAIVGKALTHTELSAEQLSRLRIQAPWVLFEAIRQLGEPSSEDHDRLFKEAHTWAERESQSAPDSVLRAICWILIETDSSCVVPIIDVMKPHALAMIAGLRNGSARHGMQYVRDQMQDIFEPGAGDNLRDRIVEHAGHLHGERIAQQIIEQLSQPDLTALEANSYLALLGHFCFGGFDRTIQEVWGRHQDEVLDYAMWAAARCPLQNVSRVLGPLVERLAALPVGEDSPKTPSDREWMTHFLGWGFRRGINEGALAYLLAAGKRDETLRQDVLTMVGDVDHPDAVELLVRHLGGSMLWSHPGVNDEELETRPRSTPTTDRLRRLWEPPDEPEKIRVYAFWIWLRATGCKDDAFLRTIEPETPFYRYAVQHRIKLGDLSAAPVLLSILRSCEWWWMLAHRVWCEELRSFASEVLTGLKGKIPPDFSHRGTDLPLHLAELLVKIPVADGEALLTEHWAHLKYSPWMIQAAFRIGTPICATLAKEAVSLYPTSVDIFLHAFFTVWKQKNLANPITLRHLENLTPYLDRISGRQMFYLAEEAERAGGSDVKIAEWIRRHLIPRLPPQYQIRVKVADQMLVDTLDRNFRETRFAPYLGSIFDERAGQRFVFPDRQLPLLDEWLSNHRTVRGLEVAAECLKHIGTRHDLDLLERYPIEGDAAEIERTKADARFSLRKRTLE